MRQRLSEVIAGLIVIAAAIAFLVFALGRTQAVGSSGYVLHAQFGQIGPLKAGDAVKIAGVTIGHVVNTRLDPKTYAAVVDFSIQHGVELPKDSSASIQSESLLGGDYLSVSPGGSDTMLKPGQAITATQSAINIESLISKYIFGGGGLSSGGSGGGSQSGNGNSGGSSSGGGGSSLDKGMPSLGGSH